MGAIIANLGYLNWKEFTIKFVAPIVATCGIFSGVMLYLMNTSEMFSFFPSYLPYLIIVLGIGFISLYPYIMFEKKKININNNMHYFITYIGTLSTLQITRTALFKRLAEKKSFGELSNVSKKILYLAKSWSLGYAQTCRKLAQFNPSKMFADFLDRFAAMLDFGQDLDVFLIDEQKSVLDDFETEYKKSMENMKMLQEIFISLTVAAGFMMSVALLLPLIMGISIEVVVRYSLLAIVIVDLFLFFLIKSIIPSDSLIHNLNIKSQEHRKVVKYSYFVMPFSIMLTGLLVWLDPLPFLVNIAIGLTPFLIIGYFGQQEEEMVFRRDKSFPAFVRSLGSIIEIKEGAVTSAISSLRVHDFGSLNDMVINIYRRLRLGCDKFQSWIYFAGESGSNMIYQFILIFSESIYLGGNAEKIGEIVSSNFQRLLSMRRLRLQLAAGLRGAFYGSLVGFTAASYITAKIAQTLSLMFSQPFELAQEGGSMSGVFSSIMPPAVQVDMEIVMVYIGIMVIIHAAISALTVKIIDGGSPHAAAFDFVIMLWIGAIISWLIPGFIGSILPDMSSNATMEELAGETVPAVAMMIILPARIFFRKIRRDLKKHSGC
ncbi:MAG: type II secretion system F family protein [Candidatus Woesearchaeota archaeon]